ncbi:MAG: L-2-hydroxyglutarate oxidase [Chloroflexota bacterium]|nr:L-2-hydroxyglutarate oxidase [Chloroflexota bacterium]
MTETTHSHNTDPAQPSSHDYDLAIVGAGIVGLATAREALLRRPGLRVVVLEKATTIASEQSSHNSGVIHSGIYYAPGSLKARACVAGHRAMLEFCREQAIPFELCGKVIVALDDSELPRLEELYQRGLANGVEGLEMIGPERLRELEPYAAGIKAIYSPNTGIIDYKLVAQAYARTIQQHGGEIITSCQVTSLTTSGNHTIIGARQFSQLDQAPPFHVGAPLACAPAPTRNGEAYARPSHALEIQARYIITCGGLHADMLSKMSQEHSAVQIVPFRGDYYLLRPQKRHMVRSLIYPVPDPRFPFLGVHFTRRPDGEVWAGPNAVLAFARNGYRRWQINPRDLWEVLSYRGSWKMAARYWRMGLIEMYRDYVKGAYVRVLQRYLPELQGSDLLPGPSGVRAQAMTPDGRLVDDFLIQHGEHVIHVQNAPSPAATSSLYIARMIVDEAARSFDIFVDR